MPERIELVTGAAPWLRIGERLLAFSAVLALLGTPTPWVWRLGGLAALALFTLIAFSVPPGRQARESMILNRDGRVRLTHARGDTDGLLDGGAWVGPWLCVLHWKALEGGQRHHSLICSSLNHADDYRRLAAWVRLGGISGRETLPS